MWMTLTPVLRADDLISIRDWTVRPVVEMSEAATFPENSPCDRGRMLAAPSYAGLFYDRRALSAGWGGDDVGDVLSIAGRRRRQRRRHYRRPRDSFLPSASPQAACPRNFNPRPRRVARIIRGYIDQSMLAPTESRTIPLRDASDWKTLDRERDRAIGATCTRWVSRETEQPENERIVWISRILRARHRKPPPVGRVATCPPRSRIPVECAIVDTRKWILARLEGGKSRQAIDSPLALNVNSAIEWRSIRDPSSSGQGWFSIDWVKFDRKYTTSILRSYHSDTWPVSRIRPYVDDSGML